MTAKDIIFTVMVIAVFGCLIYLVYYVNTESFKCMASPLTYGVSKLSYSHFEYDKSEVTCKCEAPGADNYYLVSKNNITVYPYLQTTAGSNLVYNSDNNISKYILK